MCQEHQWWVWFKGGNESPLPPQLAFSGCPVGHARWLCFTGKAESLFLSILLVSSPSRWLCPTEGKIGIFNIFNFGKGTTRFLICHSSTSKIQNLSHKEGPRRARVHVRTVFYIISQNRRKFKYIFEIF